jgi:hypothetical protein
VKGKRSADREASHESLDVRRDRLGDRVAAFSVETGAKTEAPDDLARVSATTGAGAMADPELECVENIPV